ncbi:MAG: tetratricopeptide repeat protein [Elusimicrobia bacterium]|nr:tetratricopeptide repeat protein [Elusimicrobiota bacterium]
MIIFSRAELGGFFTLLLIGGWILYPSEYTRGLMHKQEGDRGAAVQFFRDYLQRHPYHKGATMALVHALEAAGRPDEAVGPMVAFYRHRKGDVETGRAVLALFKRLGQDDRGLAFRWELFDDAKRLPVPPKRYLEELMYQAFQLSAAKQDDQATLRALTALAELSGEGDSYLGEMLRLLMERKQLDKAIELLLEAKRKQPSNVELRRTLVRVYRLSGKFDAALAEMKSAIDLEPDNIGLIADRASLLCELKRFPEAEAEIRRLVKIDPADQSWPHELAQILFEDKRPEEAFQIFESLIVRQPGDKERWWNLVYSLNDRGYRPRAIERLRAFLQRFPDDLSGEDFLVYMYQQEGQIDRAIDVLKLRIDKNPKDSERRRTLISYLVDQERLQEAADQYKKVLELEPDGADNYLNYAYIEETLGHDKEAITILENYLKKYPGDHKATEKLATLYLDAGDRARAIQLLQSTLGSLSLEKLRGSAPKGKR